MSLERWVAVLYLAACVGIGLLASRRALGSGDEYWVAGRRVGPVMNSLAIMATLASGGSIIGVMGLAYAQGIPTALALFAGAVVGFPLASILVAAPLRRFGRFTITDFLRFRYPHPLVRTLVPSLIVVSFTVYIIAQMKAAGITAMALLGIPYDTALTMATLVFILYVSLGGMLAITWTDAFQGVLMLLTVLGTAGAMMARTGSPVTIMEQATAVAPELGLAAAQPLAVQLSSFVIWASAIPVIPHIVMRVFTARDAGGARLALNLAMIVYTVMILAAVLVIVPIGRVSFPGLEDADLVFLRVMEQEFPPLFRGVAVAAILAAVMSTTDALLLACSSAISHDLLGDVLKRRLSERARHRLTVTIVWVVGLVAMSFAYSPPPVITEFYTVAVGMLSAGLFVPVVAGLWWRRANVSGGVASLLAGTVIYLGLHFAPGVPAGWAILCALPASAVAMWVGGRWGRPVPADMLDSIGRLHGDTRHPSLTGHQSA